MARSGYWLMEFLSISQFLRQAPRHYVLAYLHTETDRNDTTYFVLHQLGVIRRAITGLHDYLARKTAEQREATRLLGAGWLRGRLNHRQVALLTHALRHPGETKTGAAAPVELKPSGNGQNAWFTPRTTVLALLPASPRLLTLYAMPDADLLLTWV
jgi:Fic family protein